MEWIQNNLLALYGAIVGTIALLLNLGRFLLMYQKSVRKLKVESTVDKSAQQVLNHFAMQQEYERGNLCGPIYKITVINTSHVQLHIQDVGLTIKLNEKKEKLQAYVRNSSNGFLSHLDETGGIDIPAGARKSFSVWLSSELKIPEILGCYVVNQLGREFKGKHNSQGLTLVTPMIADELPRSHRS